MPKTEDGTGWKGTDTSREAAEAASPTAASLRQDALSAIKLQGPSTADEVALYLGRSVLSIRPRMSELRNAGLLEASGDRRKNASGSSATVWKLVEGGTDQ